MSYWNEEKLVVRIRGPEGEREVTLDQPFALIGTHSRGHIVLEGPGVRKRALVLLAIERGIYCTYLDIEELRPEQCGRWLKDDEQIQLGPYTLVARLASAAPLQSPGWNPLTARCPQPIPVVHVYCGALLKDRRRLRHPLTLIGRRPQCSLRLRGEVVSSFHSLLYWSQQRLWCLDLISSNGTRFGAEIFPIRELQLGERVEVGEFSLLYYRWSPRASTPGFSPDASKVDEDPLADVMEASFELAEDLNSDEGSTLFATSADTLESELKNEELQAALTAQQAALSKDRTQFEQERTQQNEDLKARSREVETELWRVAQEREALASSRSQLDAERQAIQQQLQEQRAELERLRRDLQTARPHEMPTQQPVVPPPGTAQPANNAQPPSINPEPPQPDAPPMAAAEMPLLVTPAGGRRKSVKKDDPTSFVSGRLSDIEHSRRWRAILIWTAVSLTALATAAAGFGLWIWLR